MYFTGIIIAICTFLTIGIWHPIVIKTEYYWGTRPWIVYLVIGLAAIVHKQQGMIFKAQGFTKLGEKYIGHFNEEMGWVEKFTERILDLGGEIKFEGMKSRDLIGDPVEYVKADLAIQEPGVELLMKCMEGVKDDPTTYDLLKDYLKDEEEDLDWSQGAVELIEKIGTQNWLLLQL